MEHTNNFNKKIGAQIVDLRRREKWTQNELAEQLHVSSQAVSSWERGDSIPDTPKIVELAKIFNVTTDYILCNEPSNKYAFTDEKKMLTYIKGYTNSKQMYESQKALQFTRKIHKNQRRNGGHSSIIHPLMMACDALAMGIDQDEIIATILLHDVCEDCGIPIDALPVSESIRKSVKSLTHPKPEECSEDAVKKRYYAEILKNESATIVTLLDCCHSVSNMCKSLSKVQMIECIAETRTYILDLQKKAKARYPEWNNILFILKYHISSVIDSIEYMINYSEDSKQK